MKVTLFNDMPDEGFLSMDQHSRLVAESLRAEGLEVNEFSVRAPAIKGVPGFLRIIAGRYLKYPWKMQRAKADINHITDQSYGFLSYFLPRRNTVLTCHDLAPLYDKTPTLKAWVNRQLWKMAIRGALRAGFIIAVSENTRRELLKHTRYPVDRIQVIYNGLHERFRPLRGTTGHAEWEKAFREKYGIWEERIVLHVGRYSQRKNFEGVLEAFAALKRRLEAQEGPKAGSVRLLQVGGKFTEQHKDFLTQQGLTGCTTQISFLPDENLPHVYNLASVLVFPSFQEGFGWPPLEAMACGTPTIVSNTSSLPEIAGEAALQVTPTDTAEIAEALWQILTDKEKAAALVEKGFKRAKDFSWQRNAEETAGVYRKVDALNKEAGKPSKTKVEAGSSQKPKIVFISANSIVGGGEIYISTLAQQLQRDGYRPLFVCPEEGPFIDMLRERNIPVVIRPLSPQIAGAARASFKINAKSLVKIGLDYLKAVWTIYHAVRQEKADIVQVNSMKAGLYAAPAGWLARKPVIWDYKDLILGDFLSPRLRKIVLLWTKLFVTKIVSASQAIRNEFLQVGVSADKVVAIHNGLDLNRFRVELNEQKAALVAGLGLPPQAEVVTIMGRLAPWKGHKVFLKAAALIKEARPQAEFLVVGDIGFDPPSYRDSLIELAGELGLNEATHWLGFRSDQAELIAASDVIVHSSIWPEPLGLTPIEAQAMATPPVAAAAGGCLETVEDGVTGLLYPMGDHEALAHAVIRLLEDPALRKEMGKAGRKRAEKLFDTRDNASKIEAVYASLLESKRQN